MYFTEEGTIDTTVTCAILRQICSNVIYIYMYIIFCPNVYSNRHGGNDVLEDGNKNRHYTGTYNIVSGKQRRQVKDPHNNLCVCVSVLLGSMTMSETCT